MNETSTEAISILPNLDITLVKSGIMPLKDYLKPSLLLYFFPRAGTAGCTQIAQDFAARWDAFQQLGYNLIGVYRDSLQRQEKFLNAQQLPFDLASDPDEVLCQAFDVIKCKKLYGRESLGIERSTFLYNQSGKLIKAWRKVRVAGHAETVLTFCRDLGAYPSDGQ